MWWIVAALFIYLFVVIRAFNRYRSGGKTEPFVAGDVDLGPDAGVKSMQGCRPHMEDSYQAQHKTVDGHEQSFYAVYDGHGGDRTSAMAAKRLHSLLWEQGRACWQDPRRALEQAFRTLDQDWLKLANKNQWDDGSTAVSCLVSEGKIYVANIGDSRAVLCSEGYRAVDMSHDHKPMREDEKRRIETLGGRIMHLGTWRVEGILAVTRSFGDRRLKKFVCADPEVVERELQPGDDFLVLASDGVWDVLSSQDAADIVRSVAIQHGAFGKRGKNSGGKGKGKGAVRDKETGDKNVVSARELVGCMAAAVTDSAYRKGSMDNITTVVVDLRQFRENGYR